MRISTNTIFDAGIAAINRQQAELLKTQQQVASGRRIAVPSDDPVAAAEVVEVSTAKSRTERFAENQGYAVDALARTESALGEVGAVLDAIRDRVIAAGNGAYSNSDRATLAEEVESRLAHLIGLANSTDGRGRYLFSGYQSQTEPFVPGAAGVAYFGDQGERLLQVTPARQMPVSVSGDEVFMRVPTGNGVFAVAGAAANTGSGIASVGQFVGTPPPTAAYRIDFTVSGGATTYEVRDAASGALIVGSTPYVPGTAIAFNGVQVQIDGAPANGDSFSITPSGAQSVFTSVQNIVSALRTPVATAAQSAALVNSLNAELANIGQATEKVLAARTTIGARHAEVEQLKIGNEDAAVQYDARLSQLQDADYAAALSDLARHQAVLEAAQRSFARVNGLSLFDYL
jgi:flagellar hook-associated protein 3 FlgL